MDIKSVEPLLLSGSDVVTVTRMGHLVEVQHMEKKNKTNHIRKIDANTYVDLSTGEVCEFDRKENRSESLNSVRQTFKKLRYLINNNFFGHKNELFVTLTYANQTNDHLQVGRDYEAFLKRFRRKFKGVSSIDSIKVLEPHQSGNFHMHVLFRFNDLDSIFLPSKDLEQIWGLGFVSVKRLENVDNIGAYVSAYLSDIEVSIDCKYGEIKKVDGVEKKFIKGARLGFYRTGVNIFSKTKGIIYPERQELSYRNVKKIVGSAKPHYSKAIHISDGNGFENVITYEQYNLKRV